MGNIQGEPSEEYSKNPSSNTIGRDPTKDKCSKGHIVIPYTQGKSIKKICRKYCIQQKEWGHLLVSVWGAGM